MEQSSTNFPSEQALLTVHDLPNGDNFSVARFSRLQQRLGSQLIVGTILLGSLEACSSDQQTTDTTIAPETTIAFTTETPSQTHELTPGTTAIAIPSPTGAKPNTVATPVPKTLSLETPASSEKLRPGQLFATTPTWTQKFSTMTDGPLSTSAWNILQGPAPANHEAEYYTADAANLRIENGVLLLQANAQTSHGKNYTSARIDTLGKEDFEYGKLTVTATLPAGAGVWPSIWMLPSDNKYEPLSPLSDTRRFENDGELDIAESVGKLAHRVYGIAHTRDHVTKNGAKTILDNDHIYHEYGLEWTPTKLQYLIDGHVFYTYDKKSGSDYMSWPFDQKFHLVINLAIGGDWGVDYKDFPVDGIDHTALPATMKVKTIQYYPYVGPKQ